MLRVARTTALPSGIENLRAEAERDGVRNMTLLAEEWLCGAQRFNALGEALFAACEDDVLLGVGGVTIQCGARAMRMRRLYVLADRRRCGVGRMLAGAMIEKGFESADLLTCNARATPAAAKFWEAMGFIPVDATGWTHQCAR